MQRERLDPQAAANFARYRTLNDPRLHSHAFVVRLQHGHGSSPVHVDPHALSRFRIEGRDLYATLDVGAVSDEHWRAAGHGQRPAADRLDVRVPEDANDHEAYTAAMAVARVAA